MCDRMFAWRLREGLRRKARLLRCVDRWLHGLTAEADGFVDGDEPVFRLGALERISAAMAERLRGRLGAV